MMLCSVSGVGLVVPSTPPAIVSPIVRSQYQPQTRGPADFIFPTSDVLAGGELPEMGSAFNIPSLPKFDVKLPSSLGGISLPSVPSFDGLKLPSAPSLESLGIPAVKPPGSASRQLPSGADAPSLPDSKLPSAPKLPNFIQSINEQASDKYSLPPFSAPEAPPPAPPEAPKSSAVAEPEPAVEAPAAAETPEAPAPSAVVPPEEAPSVPSPTPAATAGADDAAQQADALVAATATVRGLNAEDSKL